MRSKSAVLHKAGDLRIEYVDVPEPKSNEVLVKVKACGVCPFDIRLYKGLSQIKLPKVLGHELAGTIVNVGSSVDLVGKGDKVTVDPGIPCGRCIYCMNNKQNLCVNKVYPFGGFTEYVVVPQSAVYPFSDITFLEAAFAEPLACVLHSVMRAQTPVGGDVVVIGDGPNGILHLELALNFGVARVIVVGHHDERLRIAERHGAWKVVNSSLQDPVHVVRDSFDGLGADVVFVAAGSQRALLTGINMVRLGGVLVQFAGIYPDVDIPISSHLIHYSEVYLTGSSNYTPHQFQKATKLLNERRVNVKDFVTHEFSIERSVEALETVMQRRGFKVMIFPGL